MNNQINNKKKFEPLSKQIFYFSTVNLRIRVSNWLFSKGRMLCKSAILKYNLHAILLIHITSLNLDGAAMIIDDPDYIIDNESTLDIKTQNEQFLIRAAETGNYEKVKELLNSGVNVNAVRITYGNTALMLACESGQQKIVELLIQNKADVNFTNQKTGLTVLMMAAMGCRKEIFDLLLDSKADINAPHRLIGSTPLMYAASYARIDIVETLLYAGADTEKVALKGERAIDMASKLYDAHKGIRNENKKQIVKILEREPQRRNDTIKECQIIITNQIANLPNRPLVDDVIPLISQYILGTYDEAIEFEKANKNLITMLLTAKGALIGLNVLKQRSDSDNENVDKKIKLLTEPQEDTTSKLQADEKEKSYKKVSEFKKNESNNKCVIC